MIFVAVALIKLIAGSRIAFAMAETELLPMTLTEILLIEVAMPSGTVAEALAGQVRLAMGPSPRPCSSSPTA